MLTFSEFLETIIDPKTTYDLPDPDEDYPDDDYQQIPQGYGINAIPSPAYIGVNKGRVQGKQPLPRGFQPHELKQKSTKSTIAERIDRLRTRLEQLQTILYQKIWHATYTNNDFPHLKSALDYLDYYTKNKNKYLDPQIAKTQLLTIDDYATNISMPELQQFAKDVLKINNKLMDQFIKKHGEQEDIDWRPNEQTPEDYYAF